MAKISLNKIQDLPPLLPMIGALLGFIAVLSGYRLAQILGAILMVLSILAPLLQFPAESTRTEDSEYLPDVEEKVTSEKASSAPPTAPRSDPISPQRKIHPTRRGARPFNQIRFPTRTVMPSGIMLSNTEIANIVEAQRDWQRRSTEMQKDITDALHRVMAIEREAQTNDIVETVKGISMLEQEIVAISKTMQRTGEAVARASIDLSPGIVDLTDISPMEFSDIKRSMSRVVLASVEDLDLTDEDSRPYNLPSVFSIVVPSYSSPSNSPDNSRKPHAQHGAHEHL